MLIAGATGSGKSVCINTCLLYTSFVVKQKQLIEMQIEEVKYHKNLVLVKFKGIEDINMAEKYKGCYIKIKRENARKLPKDVYKRQLYWKNKN